MTKKELSINIKWDEFEMGTCRLFVETLNQYIPAVFFQDHKPKPTVSNKMLRAVNDVLDMDMTEFDKLGELLSVEHYKIKEIHIDQENDAYESVYSEVIVTIDANTQKNVIVKDGAFLCENDGTYFDTLEVVEKENDTLEKEKLNAQARKEILAIMCSS